MEGKELKQLERWAYIGRMFSGNISHFEVTGYPCCGNKSEARLMDDGYILLYDGSAVEPQFLNRQHKVKIIFKENECPYKDKLKFNKRRNYHE